MAADKSTLSASGKTITEIARMIPVALAPHLVGLLLLFPMVCSGSERIFVDVLRGDDTNLGTTEQQPLKSIAKAIELAKPGSLVDVREGDYRSEDAGWGKGTIPIRTSGTESAPIRIQGRPGAIVSRFLLKDVQHVFIEGFEFRGRKFRELANWTDMPTIVRNVPRERMQDIDFTKEWKSRKYRIESIFSTYFRLLKKLEYDIAIDLETCESITIRNNIIDGYWAGIQCRGVGRSTIVNNRISHTRNGIYTWEPSPGLRDSRIARNIISQSLDNGIDLRRNSENVVVEQNSISFSGISHIALLDGTNRSLVRWNVVSRGGFYSEAMELPGSSGLNLNQAGAGNIVEFNWSTHQIDLTGVDGNGLILDLLKDGAKTVVRGNCLAWNMGSGLNTTVSPNALVYGNVFAVNGHLSDALRNGAGIKFSREQDTSQTILGNLFLYNRASGILSYRILDKQKAIDWNAYVSSTEPLIWDGFASDERSYRSMNDVRANSPWEKHGIHVSWP